MTTSVVIYQPSKTAMQSGRANTKRWVLEFDQAEGKKLDGLMGWAGSGDMNSQLKLYFADRREAESYAKRKGYRFRVVEPKSRTLRPKSYAANFAYGKVS